ncbi:MAG: T9SS type A sorting domain-containing protein [Ignavibacteriaceae bacterium]|nr:T9SS type A sorting domain-containing protein [Ignavibacteriaceae bacterium]
MNSRGFYKRSRPGEKPTKKLLRRFSFPFIYTTMVLTILLTINLSGTIRYVKANNLNPVIPYTSWAGASNTIQKCIDLCAYGDTIYIANGVYREVLRLKAGIKMTGEDKTNTIIESVPEPVYDLITLDYDNTLDNMTIVNPYSAGSIYLISFNLNLYDIEQKNLLIQNCILKSTKYCFYLGDALIKNCILQSNAIILKTGGVFANVNANITIENCVLKLSREGSCFIESFDYGQFLYLKNNIFIYESDYQKRMYEYIRAWVRPFLKIENNLFYQKEIEYAELNIKLRMYPGDTVRNNVFMYTDTDTTKRTGIYISGFTDVAPVFTNNLVYGFHYAIANPFPNSKVHNNAFWQTAEIISGVQPNVYYENITAEPMFMRSVDSGYAKTDFRLQANSPLIDAGDSTLPDPDGSRSDIGVYGGPGGWSYTYTDLAPRVPKNVRLNQTGVPGEYILKWSKNHETDFLRYEVYSDTLPGFSADTTKMVYILSDTMQTIQTDTLTGGSRYYKIRSIDRGWHRSEASAEAGIITIAGEGKREQSVKTEGWKLYQNYPNPFNPSTTIEYELESRSRVKIEIYNSMGELVQTAEDSEKEAGYHSVNVTMGAESGRGYSNDAAGRFASGIYIYTINVVESESGIPVYRESKKMILLR